MGKIKKRVLICGSTGFIGRNLVEYFADDDNFEVTGTYFSSRPLNHSNIRMVQADLTQKEDVNKVMRDVDAVIQAAASTSGSKDSFTRPYYHVTDNAVMNALIFRAAYDYKVSHVVFLSCTTMYQSSDNPIKESDFDPKQEIYPNYFGGAWTKVYNEKMCEFYSRLGTTKYTVIRHSNIYGPYDKFDLEKSHVFGATITKVMQAKENSRIVVWGGAEEKRDLLYISDLVNFVRCALKKQESKFEIFNAGCGSSISVNEMVKKIIAFSGKSLDIEHDLSKPSINTKICLDCTKARTLLGWFSLVSLEDGIKRTIEWYKQNRLSRGKR